jgi:hypothetical protein
VAPEEIMTNLGTKMLKRLAAFVAVSFIAACGGGGGSSGSSPFGSGQSAPTGPTAANLVLQLDSATIDNSGAASVKATATATTASGQAVTGVPVTFSVDNKAIFSVDGSATGPNGQVVATVSPGPDPSNRIVTVTAMSGSLTATASFAVTGAKLTGTAVPVNVLPGSSGNRVDFRLVNANETPIAGQPFSVSAGSLPTVTGVTGAAGNFSYTYTAPTVTGPLDITASAGGVTNTQTVTVASVSSVPPAPIPVLSASVSANPSVVATNTSTTNNRTEIRALFVGANNTPVPNVRVRFDLEGDVSSVGGSFSAGDNTATGDKSVVYSDANGIATTAYIPGTRSSPTNGVTIRACYDLVDFAVCNPVQVAKTTITVAADPLAVTIGTNEFVYTGPNDLTYIRKFVILVVDSSGRAKGNVDIVPSVDIDRFYKGQFVKGGGDWFKGFIQSPLTDPPTLVPFASASCFNEDLNRNGVREVGEDINHSAALEPRKSDVAVTVLGTGKTDSSGTATVQIEYPKNVASWARVKVLVAATGVSGTEGRATWTEVLPYPVAAVQGDGAPAFVASPYGTEIFDGTINLDGTITYAYPNGPLGPFPFAYPDGTIPAPGSVITPCRNPD